MNHRECAVVAGAWFLAGIAVGTLLTGCGGPPLQEPCGWRSLGLQTRTIHATGPDSYRSAYKPCPRPE